MIKINDLAPDFSEEALINGNISRIKLSDYRGKWVVLFFYPADFTFVCPTELLELSRRYEEIKRLDAEIISISTDTVYAHKAWHDSSESIKNIKFPMLGDPARRVVSEYSTLIKEEGMSTRATFIISPEGKIKAFEFHDNSIGRSSDEIIRKLQAAIFVAENNGSVCPMSWKPGAKALKPSTSLIGKI